MTPRRATFAAFLTFGICIGLWSGSIPTVAARATVTPAMLGVATTLFIACSILGLASAGMIARHVPLRRTLMAAVIAVALIAALALQSASASAFFGALALFGYLIGIFDGTMNAEGTAVERDLGRPVLAGFHAAASFASALGAGIGGAVSVRIGTPATAALALAAAAVGVALIRAGTPLRAVDGRRAAAGTGGTRGPGMPIILIGIIAGLSMAGEVSSLMFAASTFREQAPALAAWAGFGVTAFSLCQAVARSGVDAVRRRFADGDIITWSAGLAAVGFLIVATGSGIGQSALGFSVIGIGTAAIVPCCFALAPRASGLGAAQAIGVLSLVSAIPRVPQPIGFGELAAQHGFAAAYALNAVLMLGALALTLILRRSVLART